MASKYFVYGEGQWRKLDLETGRITGWRGRAKFVYVRRGKLVVARRRPVLQALKALAAGQPSAAADGMRLPYVSKSEQRRKKSRKSPSPAPEPSSAPAEPPTCLHQDHCCAYKRSAESTSASQANAKEYSNMEDHAIVAWVSSGSRASRVSGNSLWRDLEEQYERLTGRTRSWHSLRNRYLRYILPSLGALHLPPATVSRLRAAAATGVIKTNQRLRPSGDTRAKRRHSMFQEPVPGASSRRPRSVASSDGETHALPDTSEVEAEDDAGPSSPKRRSLRLRPDAADRDAPSKNKAGTSQVSAGQQSASKKNSKPPPRRSPRYSEVTRRFAARHRAPSTSPSPSPAPSPPSTRAPSPVLQPATRSRRLFNPNANV